jgi:hypothetical protein
VSGKGVNWLNLLKDVGSVRWSLLCGRCGVASAMQRREGDGGARRPDWLCRLCEGTDGQPFRNFGSRTACFKCARAKGSCHLVAPPPRSLAERQVRQQREGDRVLKLQKECERLQKLLKAGAKDKEADNGEEELVVEEFDYTVEELLAQRRTLVQDCRKSVEHTDVRKLDKQIALQREAKLAELPDHVRINKLDKRVKDAHAALDRLELKKDKLDTEMEALQQRIKDHAADTEKAKEHTAEAEHQRMQLFATLRPQLVVQD